MATSEGWTGAYDARGRPHGRGCWHLGKRARFEGRMDHGVRSGIGTLFTEEHSDEEVGDGGGAECPAAVSALRVHWADDLPHGRGIFTEPDGTSLVGTWHHGELRGIVHEQFADGCLRYIGRYEDGVRHGDGIEILRDGGCLVGSWNERGLHGAHCAYLYPCMSDGLALVGEWRHGQLHRASAARCTITATAVCAALIRPHRLPREASHPALDGLIEIAASPSPSSSLAEALVALYGRRDPRAERRSRWIDDSSPSAGRALAVLREPYEEPRVFVRPSTLGRAAGDGLFARRHLEAGEVAAFFAGVRVRHETDGAGSEGGCAGGIVANEGQPPAGIDADWGVPATDGWVWLPASLRAMGQYSASLGHKANHAGWRANCELTPYEHPVFGSICCVRVLPHVTDAHGAAGIAAGTELTVLPLA